MEADQRHAELIVRAMKLKEGSKSVLTPGVKVKGVDQTELPKEEATTFQANVARGNYLTQDRTDIEYAVKELQ